MDFRDSPEEAAFRDRLRGWLTEQKGKFPTSGDEYWAKAGEWHVALYEAGFFGTSWPKAYGGQDLPPVYDVIVDEEIAKAGAPARPSLGYLVVGLSHHGDEELRQRFLPGMINGTERWCQGFSEPGAGSDLASLTTTAVRDGDEYVIAGHKIWTSYSDVADWCLVLARTDKDVPKHKGISAFIVDDAPARDRAAAVEDDQRRHQGVRPGRVRRRQGAGRQHGRRAGRRVETGDDGRQPRARAVDAGLLRALRKDGAPVGGPRGRCRCPRSCRGRGCRPRCCGCMCGVGCPSNSTVSPMARRGRSTSC